MSLLPATAHSPPADSLRRYESLQAGLDLVDQGFTLIGEDLRMLAWNKSFLRLLDFPQDMAYVGAPFESFMRFNAARGEGGEYADGDKDMYKRMGSTFMLKAHDFERVRPNGCVLRVRGEPVPGFGFVTIYSDVTQQRQSENIIRDQNALLESRVVERTAELSAINAQMREALHQNQQIAASLQLSEAQMHLITDSIPALVAYFDSERNYRYINRGYRDWFGLDPGNPQAVSARDFLGVDTYTRIKPNVARAFRGEAVTFEYDITTFDGRALVARTSLIPELATDGAVVGCFELTFDITEERHSHELLVQAEKMQALGQLTGGLAHDFNNILTVILGNLVMLAEQPSAKAHVEDFIIPAIDAARRGSKLIQGLLSFSRTQPLEAKVIDLNPLVMAVDTLVGNTLPEAVKLTTSAAASPLMVCLDPHQLQNVLLNLILNARDALDGRGDIAVRCVAAVLDDLHAAHMGLPAGRYACVQVEDNGCGMDAATKARVFEPFFTTKIPGRGTGLGMATVYGFARQSNGAIDIWTEPGKGTRVTLWLPVIVETLNAQAAPAALAQLQQPPQIDSGPTGHRGLALLVEDDAGVRQIVRRLLLDFGFAVIEAETGAEAIDIIDQTPGIALVLSDIVMPGGVNGRQVARHAIGHGGVEKIILMSGYAPDGDELPGVPMLAKPFTKAQLATLLVEPVS